MGPLLNIGGVSWHGRDRHWEANIRVGGTLIYLGSFAEETHAAQAYDNAARKYFESFAAPNFPENTYTLNMEDLPVRRTDHDEERALFAAARGGDETAKETLIRNHMDFAASIGHSLSRGRLPRDEVVSASHYALVLAFENFNPKYANRFSAFIRSHVRGAIARLWKEKNLVQKSDFSDGPVSTCEILEDDITEEHPLEEDEHHAFLLELLEKAKHVLDEREAKIFSMLYSEEKNSLTSVGVKLKLTRERIRQIHDEALEKLRAELRRQMNENNINQ